MIKLAFGILSAALVLGAGLAVLHMRGPAARPPPWIIGLAHGMLGAAGLVALIAGLREGLPRSRMGVSGFGATAAALLGVALLLGIAIAGASWRRRRPAGRPGGALIGAHAGFAIAGLVMLGVLIALE